MFLPQSEPRYALQIRVPMSFAERLKQVAAREMTSLSGLIRQVLTDRLKAEGVDPVALIGADAAAPAAGQPHQENFVS